MEKRFVFDQGLSVSVCAFTCVIKTDIKISVKEEQIVSVNKKIRFDYELRVSRSVLWRCQKEVAIQKL